LKKLSVYIILLTSILLASCDGYNRLLKSSNYELKLERANQYYQKGNYVKASALYEELIPVYKGTDKAEEIYFYFSYCNYYQGDYSVYLNIILKIILEVFLPVNMPKNVYL
jgi:outer membrane protein assembly factor BamD